MCGIAGLLTTRTDLDLGRPLAGMLQALRHRGPDDEGCEEVDLPGGYRLGLAHTRLAILDLSPTGHQPMADPASGSWIVYNGEVYNHQALRRQIPGCRFRGSSDTETILQAWVQQGEAAIRSLRGMFAFALYDGRRHQFWLVRDRLGIKPLYVCRPQPDTWLFASELRALLASGLVARRLHAPAVDAYLALGAVPAPWTLIEGVSSLLPGEAWRFDLSPGKGRLAPERRRYWRPPFTTSPRSISHNEAAEQLRTTLREAVTLRMLSDVPVGVFLSGGIDSSALVATLASQGYSPRTFSIIFGERRFDESDHSRLVARQFGTDHAELFLQPARVLGEFDNALAAYDQPSIDGVNTYFISQLTRRAGVKVALSGIGGDELFAGYSYFRHMSRLERPWPRRVARLAHLLLRWLRPQDMRTIKLGAVLGNTGSRLEGYAICRQVMPPERRQAVLRQAPAEHLHAVLPPELAADLARDLAGLDAVNAHSLLELSLYMANMLLRDTDQMSMAHGMEVREPLLDHVLVEEVARLPGPLKLLPGRSSRTKGLLVDALDVPLPRAILRRPKMGFIFPWEHWLRHELKDRVTATLGDPATLAKAGLNPAGVQAVWDGYLASQPGVRYTDILCLLHLLFWVERHHLSLDPLPPTAAVSSRI